MADMMPREEDNSGIIEEGMATITQSFRPGLQAFFETDAFFENDSRNFKQRVNKVITVLNVRDMRNGVPAAFELLTTDSLERSEELIKEFLAIIVGLMPKIIDPKIMELLIQKCNESH